MCSVTNNGFHSEFFNISRGISQGCPISALLFILCVEVLAIYIREQENIKGIMIGNNEIRITQFADDICLYLDGTNSLENVIAVFEDFYRYAGLRLNIEKTEAIWLGKTNRFGKICNIKITNRPVKVLGIWISKDFDEMLKINFDERIEKLNTLLNIWSQRNLTIKGRITILKAKALPLVTYVSTCLYVPKHIIDTIDKVLYNFVWKKKHHVKRTTIIASPSQGGLKMPDFNTFIRAHKINFMKRLTNASTNCNKTASFILKTNNVENFLKYKNEVKYLHPVPKFYEQLLDIWYSIHNKEPMTVQEILQEDIWFNSNILIGNKPTYNKEWDEAGIRCIQNLVEGNSLMAQETITQKYKVTCDILFYNGLRTAIPRSWLAKINDEINLVGIVANSEQPLTVIIKNNRIDLRRVKCSQVYWSEINKIMERPTCYYKWESEYFYATFDWDLINVIPYECTTETFLQSLQFKIIHRYFPCNYRLHLWNIVEDSKCTYCNIVDTLNHYFAECQVFWESVKRWFLRVFQFVINVTPLDILLGIPNYDNSNVIMNLNFVILFAKYFIHDCKKNDKPVDFYHFQVKLKTRMVIEEYRYELYNRKLDFLVKWSVLSDSL